MVGSRLLPSPMLASVSGLQFHAVLNRSWNRSEQVLVLPVHQPRGHDVRAQPGPLALGHQLLEREQLLEAAVGAAALVLLLGQRLLRLLRVGRRPRPRHHRRDPDEHLLVLKLLDAADRLEQGLGAVHRIEAVEYRQFALAEGREQRLGRGVDHPLHPARLLSAVSKGAEDLEFLVLAGEEAFAKDLPNVLAGVQDEDLARRSRVLVAHAALLLWAAAPAPSCNVERRDVKCGHPPFGSSRRRRPWCCWPRRARPRELDELA